VNVEAAKEVNNRIFIQRLLVDFELRKIFGEEHLNMLIHSISGTLSPVGPIVLPIFKIIIEEQFP
jgi:hypothetical protein